MKTTKKERELRSSPFFQEPARNRQRTEQVPLKSNVIQEDRRRNAKAAIAIGIIKDIVRVIKIRVFAVVAGDAAGDLNVIHNARGGGGNGNRGGAVRSSGAAWRQGLADSDSVCGANIDAPRDD